RTGRLGRTERAADQLAVDRGEVVLDLPGDGGRGADLRLGHGHGRRVEDRAVDGRVQLVGVVQQRRGTTRLDLDLPDAGLRVRVRTGVRPAAVGVGVVAVAV